jgi:phospholipid N-methyltransferase
MPSSSDLARAMASALPETGGMIVELGGGTGAITAALLERGVLPEDILIIGWWLPWRRAR